MATESSKALTVLRDTVGKSTALATGVSPTGTRLVAIAGLLGYNGARSRLSLSEITQLSAAMICLDVISQDIAKVTLRMYERLPAGGKKIVTDHPVAALLASQPNQYHTWYEFHQMVLLHLGILQNAYIAKRIRDDGTVEELIPAMPARTTMIAVEPKEARGFFAYEVRRLSPQERILFSGLRDIFLPGEFIHIRTRMMDGLSGLSNLETGAKTFGLANELVEYQTRLYRNDGQLRGVFQKPGGPGDTLSDEAYQRLKDDLDAAMTAYRRENRPLVLEEGITFQHIAMNSDQAEVAKARDAAVVDMARTFRIPPHKMMHLVNVKYENMETLEKSYVQDSLIPYAMAIEQKYKTALLDEDERSRFFFEFDRQEMLLNDMEKMADALDVQAKYGAVEIDEIRQAFGRNPLPNNAGKVRIIPSTYNVVDDKNEVVIAAGAQPQNDADNNADTTSDNSSDKKKPKKGMDDESEIVPFPILVGERT